MHVSKGPALILIVALALIVTAFFVVSPGEQAPSGKIVFTQIPVESTSGAEQSDWRFPEQSRIVALGEDGKVEVLTKSFYAARSPEISFDGLKLLFSGKKKADDPWQIWEMDLKGGEARKLSDTLTGCTDPSYLPGEDGVVFSALSAEGQHALYTVKLDGCCLDRITYRPESDFSTSIMRDGRVLYATGAGSASDLPPSLFAIIYDGTKDELFYRPAEGKGYAGRAREVAKELIVFVESESAGLAGGKLVSVELKRPLKTRVDLSDGDPGRFHSLYPLGEKSLVVAYRSSESEPYGLYQFDLETRSIGEKVYSDPEYQSIEPVVAVRRPRIMAFPSIVDKTYDVGLLYGIDADFSSLPPADPSQVGTRSSTLRILTLDGVLGEVPLEADGSFNLEVPADTPLRFETMDEQGRVVRGPSDWVWVRPFDQRGCIGCHEDKELAPPNVLPLAITKPHHSLRKSAGNELAASGDSQGM